MVPSMSTYSKSASTGKTLNTRSKTPFLAHLRKRWKTEFHNPNSSSKSRHGAPVRAIHRTASRNSRLSVADRPGSPSLPGSSDATRAHCESLRILRTMRPSPFGWDGLRLNSLPLHTMDLYECQQALVSWIGSLDDYLGQFHQQNQRSKSYEFHAQDTRVCRYGFNSADPRFSQLFLRRARPVPNLDAASRRQDCWKRGPIWTLSTSTPASPSLDALSSASNWGAGWPTSTAASDSLQSSVNLTPGKPPTGGFFVIRVWQGRRENRFWGILGRFSGRVELSRGRRKTHSTTSTTKFSAPP